MPKGTGRPASRGLKKVRKAAGKLIGTRNIPSELSTGGRNFVRIKKRARAVEESRKTFRSGPPTRKGPRRKKK